MDPICVVVNDLIPLSLVLLEARLYKARVAPKYYPTSALLYLFCPILLSILPSPSLFRSDIA